MTLLQVADTLAEELESLTFTAPVAHVYNPLLYARQSNERYLERYGSGPKQAVFVGMNPGPWGMAQTGVPFGEIASVRDWLRIEEKVGKPEGEHPKKQVTGFSCRRSEVSGRRLWGLFRSRFPEPEQFFARFFVVNYCPLLFLDGAGRNLTPDKLNRAEQSHTFDGVRPGAAAFNGVPPAGAGYRCGTFRRAPGGRRLGVPRYPGRADPSPQSSQPGRKSKLGRNRDPATCRTGG